MPSPARYTSLDSSQSRPPQAAVDASSTASASAFSASSEPAATRQAVAATTSGPRFGP